jgi:DNA-binding transcriptional MerR regulator
MIADAHSPAGVLFVDVVEPLRLIDPTAAARLLKVRRHTLACYRNRGLGPTYYKFGRGIRYAEMDLTAWATGSSSGSASCPVRLAEPSPNTVLVDTKTAARFLTVTIDCLKNYRKIGEGPRSRRLGRRIHYSTADLVTWAQLQRRASSCVHVEGISMLGSSLPSW